MFEAVLFFHFCFAAMLFGAPMGLTRNLKTCLEAGSAAFKAGAADAEKRSKIAGISAIGLLLTGVGLILLKGGFGAVNKSYHAALTLMIVAIVVGIVVNRRAVNGISAAAAADSLDNELARSHIKKLAMGTGIVHLIWAILLGLMVHPF